MTLELKDVAQYMGMGLSLPEGSLAERVDELSSKALKTVRPAGVWRRFPITESAIVSGGVRLELEGLIRDHLAGCGSAYLVCGTLGAEFDAFHRRVSVSSGADALIVQAIGSALIEKTMDSLQDDIRQQLLPGETLLGRYSPGYGAFPLSAQKTLLRLIDAPKAVGVSLTDSFLMVPSKSVSAVIGVKNE